MKKDPFGTGKFLNRDFDTSYGESEQWQGALKNEEDTERVARERRGDSLRIRFFTFAIAAMFIVLTGRLMVLQIWGAEENAALAEGNRVRTVDIAPPRGVVYDSEGAIIAKNTPNFEVRVVPLELPPEEEERTKIYQKLSGPLEMPTFDIRKKAEAKGLDYNQSVLVKDGLGRDNAVLLRLRAQNLAGVTVQNNPRRKYGKTELWSHLLGYVGKVTADDLKKDPTLRRNDYSGKTGLEQVYQKRLAGQAGQRRLEVNASGDVLKELETKDPVPGSSLQLGIDTKLQQVMYDAVNNGVRSSPRNRATGGSAIAMDPKTGTILGMVSLPTFDNNDFVDGIGEKRYKELAENPDRPLFTRPTSAEYPPGSTFKLVTATAALGEGVIDRDRYLASPGEIEVGGGKFVDWKEDGHGSANVVRALAVSSDVYFYKVSGGFEGEIRGVGPDKLGDYMRQYGIGKPTGIDLPNEQDGLVPSPNYKKATFDEDWFIGNTYQMGIGQGFVLTTPLQVLTFTAAVANDGVAYQPHLVKSYVDSVTKKKRRVEPQPLVNLKVEREIIEAVQEGMREAVNSGTSIELKELPLEICGKTGSAEFANETKSHAWFTSYAPCKNPKIVLTVMIEGGGEGSETAVPAAKRIYQHFFNVSAEKVPGRVKPAGD